MSCRIYLENRLFHYIIDSEVNAYFLTRKEQNKKKH